jgi:hypothetical protein
MLGFYENFPENVHNVTHFATSISVKRLQQVLIQMFHEINGKTFDLNEVACPSVPHCIVIFEFGIAEDNNFNYLDEEEANKLLKVIQKKPFQIMDFYCAVRYYKMQNEKKTPLKFDYYVLRFTFNKGLMGMQIFHERGLRYVSPEDLINFIISKINEISSKKILKAFEPSSTLSQRFKSNP